jgi:hypothetical protein
MVGDEEGPGAAGEPVARIGRPVVPEADAFASSKTLCRSHNLIAKTPPAAVSGGELGQQAVEDGSQPLDPARQSF